MRIRATAKKTVKEVEKAIVMMLYARARGLRGIGHEKEAEEVSDIAKAVEEHRWLGYLTDAQMVIKSNE